MNQAKREEKNTRVSNTANTRFSGRWPLIARAVWLALVVPSLGLFVAGLPAYYWQLQRAQTCVSGDCLNGGLTVKDLQTLSTHGFSVSGYAAVLTTFFALTAAVWCVVGLLLFWRRSDDRLALLAAFTLVMGGITFGGTSLYALVLTFPVLDLPVSLLQFLGSASISVFLLFFPNGRLVPRWMGLILLLGISFQFVDTLPSTGSHFDEHWPGWLYLLQNLVVYGAIVFSQIYRYRRVSTPVQRQQTKWVVSGGAVALGTFVGLLVLSGLFPSFVTIFANAGWTITLPIAFLAIPLSIGFSIARYRLYDIDTLINRAVVYVTLTLILLLIYLGLVFGAQNLLVGLIGNNNGIVIVGSTLIVAMLFQPLRRGIQNIIDRRFYRQKYDTSRVLQAFSGTLHQEVDLTHLSEQIVIVVQETVQPAHVSLWLIKTERQAPPLLPASPETTPGSGADFNLHAF